MQLIQTWLSNGWSVVMVILGLGLIIFLHELGHFLMAKKNKVRVEIFSLGFGQAIWKFRRGETEYRIAWLPLGGYVKMAGETLMDERKGEPFELTSKTPWQRFQIFVAGAVMNLLIAFPISILAYVVGMAEAPTEIGKPGRAEALAGILPGDVVLEVDGQRVENLDKFRLQLLAHSNGTRVPVRIRRGDKEIPLYVEAMRSSDHQSIAPALAMPEIKPESKLGQLGVREGDEIYSVDGKRVVSHTEVDATLRNWSGPAAAKEVKLQFLRRGLTLDQDKTQDPVTVQLPKKTWYVIPRDDHLMQARVGMVGEHVPAAGKIKTGDLIVEIGGHKIESWVDLKAVVEKGADQPLQFGVMRDDERVTLTITPKKNENGVGAIGISPRITNVFASVVPGSYFARMGLQSGDKIVAIDGFRGELTLEGFPKEKISPVWDLHEPDPKTVQLDVERNGQTVKVSLVAEPQDEADLASVGFPTNHSGYLTTMESKPFRRRALGDAFKMGLKEPVDVTIMTFDILKKLVTGGESASGLSGPIGIIHASYAFAKMHFGNFVWLLCLITVNLGIFNLLPIPILDGGHNLLLLIEVVRKWFGKPPPSEKFIAGFQYVGLAFILSLFVFVTFNDITRFFGPRG